MRSRSVEAGCGGKYSSQSSFCVVTAAHGADGAGGDDRCCARRGEAQHNALFQNLVGKFARLIARRVVQHGKTADAARLDEFLELTRMIGRSTEPKSPDAADVIDKIDTLENSDESATRGVYPTPGTARQCLAP